MKLKENNAPTHSFMSCGPLLTKLTQSSSGIDKLHSETFPGFLMSLDCRAEEVYGEEKEGEEGEQGRGMRQV